MARERTGGSSAQDALETIGGTALRVYLVMVRLGRPVGVRELQRLMGFKSPSTAKHHLSRLAEMGLVVKDRDGNYRAVYKGELLPLLFTRLMGRLIPTLAPLGFFGIVVALTDMLLFGPRAPSLTVALLAISSSIIYLSLRIKNWINKLTRPPEQEVARS